LSTDLGTKRETDIAVALGGRKFDWQRLLKAVCVVVAILAYVALFYKRSYIGIVSRDSIDIAQIAANISEGHGFTTRFVRPFNALYFKDVSGYYPELNHGPLFPYIVAVLFKLRTVSEQVIVWASLLFFLLTSVATYVLGRLLFDWRVGLLATGIFSLSLGALNAAISGEEWTMCAFLFTLLLCAMASHHTSVDTRGGRHGITCAALSAVLLAALYMTHHMLVILVLPTAVYFGVTGVRRRLYLLVFLGVCAAAVTPWAVRNGLATGIPVLGASGWDMIANTSAYPGDTLYRTVELANHSMMRIILFPTEQFAAFVDKLARGTSGLAQDTMSVIGYFAMAFAVVGMLYRFRSRSANALRGYLYGALPLMIACFALFSVDREAVILFAPLAAVLASAYLLLLLDAKKLHPFFVNLLVGGLVALTSLPAFVEAAWPGGRSPSAATQQLQMLLAGDAFNQNIATTPVYTDVPWAVAWGTKGVGVWLPVSDQDCQILTGMSLPVNMILLTPECESYQPDEIWYALHRIRVWREYIRDPDRGLDDILKTAGLTLKDVPRAPKIIERILRRFKAADTVRGFFAARQDPFAPDCIQIFMRSEAD
jgi:hypothetical protein